MEGNDECKNIIKKNDNVHYINTNYVLKPIYNDENECVNHMLLDANTAQVSTYR